MGPALILSQLACWSHQAWHHYQEVCLLKMLFSPGIKGCERCLRQVKVMEYKRIITSNDVYYILAQRHWGLHGLSVLLWKKTEDWTWKQSHSKGTFTKREHFSKLAQQGMTIQEESERPGHIQEVSWVWWMWRWINSNQIIKLYLSPRGNLRHVEQWCTYTEPDINEI